LRNGREEDTKLNNIKPLKRSIKEEGFKKTKISDKKTEKEQNELKQKAKDEHRTCNRTNKLTRMLTEGRSAGHTAVNGRNLVSKQNTISQHHRSTNLL
jgi:hypothetical protein